MEPDLRLSTIDRDGALAEALARLHGHTRADLLRGALLGGGALLAASSAPRGGRIRRRPRRVDPELRADARGAAGGLLHRGGAQPASCTASSSARPTRSAAHERAHVARLPRPSWGPRRSSDRTSTSAARRRAPTHSGARRLRSRTWRSPPTRARRRTYDRARTSPRRWPSTRWRRATPRGSGGWRASRRSRARSTSRSRAATATRIVGAHALRDAQDEPQGAQVHRLIAAVGAAIARHAPRRLRRAGRRRTGRTARSPTSPRRRAGDCRSARRSRCAPIRMPCNGHRCGEPRSRGRRRHRGARAVARLASRTPEDTTNLVLVLGRARDARGGLWIRARLPARRAQTGWLPRSALGGYEDVHTRLIVDRARLTLTLLRNGRAVFRAPVGIGRAATPTPAGAFYVRDRLRALRQPVLRAGRLRHQRAVRHADRLARRRLCRDPRDQRARARSRSRSRTAASACATPTSCASPGCCGSGRRSRSAETYPPGPCPTSTAPPAGACARAWPLPLAARARARRHERFFALTGVAAGDARGRRGLRGAGPARSGARPRHHRASTSPRARSTRDRSCRPTPPSACPSTTAPSTSPTARASSSTSIRRGAPAFAAEMRRVARGWFVQTPAWSFPIEPHALLPVRPLAAARAAAPVLAPGRRRGVGGHRAAAPRRDGRPVRRAGPRRAAGRRRQELDRAAGDRYLERLIHSPHGCE